MDDSLKVLYTGLNVGVLKYEKGKCFFAYDPNLIENGFSISPRSLPLRMGVFQSEGIYFEGLFGVFADSLPDGWGMRLAMKTLSKKGIDYGNLSPLEKLRYIGEDGLGGLSFEPNYLSEDEGKNEDYTKIALAVKQLLNDEESIDLDSLYRYGGSSGGAKPKAHLRIEGEDWIVKFPRKEDPSDIGVMEFDYNLAAKECGLRVSNFRLLPSKDNKGYFASKRFDRKGNKRIHVLSLSGFLDVPHTLANLDYVTLLQSVNYLTSSKEELLEGYRRACFNVLAKNKDDHGKNFSFIFDEDRRSYILSPAFDLTYTPFIKEHEMTCMGSGNPDVGDLIALAKKMGIKKEEAERIISFIQEVVTRRLSKYWR